MIVMEMTSRWVTFPAEGSRMSFVLFNGRLIMRVYTCKPEYLTKALELSDKKAERLLSRMSVHLHSQLVREGYSPQEIMAIQLQIEDEQLQDWRARVAQMRKQDRLWLEQNTHLANRSSLN